MYLYNGILYCNKNITDLNMHLYNDIQDIRSLEKLQNTIFRTILFLF